MKKLLGLLCMAVFTAVALALSGSQSWVLVHKVEFCLLVGALIVVCLIHPANTGQVPNEFRTLRLNYIGWLISLDASKLYHCLCEPSLIVIFS